MSGTSGHVAVSGLTLSICKMQDSRVIPGNLWCWIHVTVIQFSVALSTCREEVVQYLPSNTIEDIESNVEKIVTWVQQCKR